MKKLISLFLCAVLLVSVTMAGGPVFAESETIAPALQATLDYIDNTVEITEQDIAYAIKNCSNNEKETALRILSVYVDSLK